MAVITPFEIYGGGVYFAPFFYPNRVIVSKAQKLARDGSPCGGEDVNNIGSENREIHIVGIIRQQEKQALDSILDQDEPVNLISMSWSGEVLIEEGEYEGPVGVDPHTNEYHWQYTLDLVSTGANETTNRAEDGIVRPVFGALDE